MATQLHTSIKEDITIGELRCGVGNTIREITGNDPPFITTWTVCRGERCPVKDETSIVNEGLFVLEAPDFDVQVLFIVTPSFESDGQFICGVSSEYSMNAIEKTLAACCTVWLARRSESNIEDDTMFWTNAMIIAPDDLVQQIRVSGIRGFDKACEGLVGTRLMNGN